MVGAKSILGVEIGFVKLFAVWGLLWAGLCYGVIRLKRAPNLALFSWPLGLLIAFNALGIARYEVRSRSPAPQPVAANAGVLNEGQKLPDIYYIVLDAYSRDDMLQAVLGYDNSAFLEALRARGFYVAECAHSNYDATEPTVTSVLNYETLENLRAAAVGGAVSDTVLVHNNRARQVFKSYGYQFVSGRGYAPFNDITEADVYLNYEINQGVQDHLAEKRFTSLYLNTTVFRLLAELYKNSPERFSGLPAWLSIDQSSSPALTDATFWYRQNNYMFDLLEQIPNWQGGYFVYAHINSPHVPYVYRADGSFRYPLNDADEKVMYSDAITYLNKRVLRVIDTLLQSDPAPVIILQADHGMHKMTTGLDKYKILSAYYLPGELNTPPYATITPVNDFRLVLRNYFDPSVELLPDTQWVKFLNDYEAVPSTCDRTP